MGHLARGAARSRNQEKTHQDHGRHEPCSPEAGPRKTSADRLFNEIPGRHAGDIGSRKHGEHDKRLYPTLPCIKWRLFAGASPGLPARANSLSQGLAAPSSILDRLDEPQIQPDEHVAKYKTKRAQTG